MATAAPQTLLESIRTRPLSGRAITVAILAVWFAGALYCSGYERLLSGLHNWPGSLWWSAVAVLPWLALFEWSKTAGGRRLTRGHVAIALALTTVAALSMGAEALVARIAGERIDYPLSLLRRIPAAGACLLLILWSRAGQIPRRRDELAEASLAALAPSLDWVEAADNYVELHIGPRTVMRRMTMRDAERALEGRGFLRIHRRYLVNGSRISAVTGSSGDRIVRLLDGQELPVGRAYAPNLSRAA
jgi:hypothetical protein